MTILILFFQILCSPESSSDLSYNIHQAQNVCEIYGRIKLVQNDEQFRVRVVNYGEDMRIRYVDYAPINLVTWKLVHAGEDYRIKLVDSGEDFRIRIVSYGEGCTKKL